MPNKLAGTPTWGSWHAMRQRCNDPNARGWKHYGARGIRVCDRWATFAPFLVDMGERPDGLTLDRIDCNGHYEPANCRWATIHEQNRNTRACRTEIFDGRSMLVTEWAEHFGIERKQLFNYMRRRTFPEALRCMGVAV